jgi:hypothetical protein
LAIGEAAFGDPMLLVDYQRANSAAFGLRVVGALLLVAGILLSIALFVAMEL